jgi:DNA (cytosine-5)-methyltransferase 1
MVPDVWLGPQVRIIPVAREGVVSRIDELLEASYGSADLGNLSGVLDETVFILLSQQTRDRVYRAVFGGLRARFSRWLDVLAAPPEELERVLGPAGFGARRTAQLRALLQQVEEADQQRELGPFATEAGDLSLEFLRSFSDGDAEEFLLGLPGIGPKSARCVLAYALERPAFAVDTHVLRIFTRLGIAGAPGRKQAHDPFQDAVAPKIRHRLHMNLVHHGRAVCREQRPRCGDCVLVSFCATGQKAVAALAPEQPTAIDLFAGAGGLAQGFREAGFRISGAIEMDRPAAQTYRFNHPGTPVIEAEITEASRASDIRRALPHLGQPEALIAGAPCQGYSAAGNRLPDDPRNRLFEPVARIARGLNVAVAVFENVPGVRNIRGQGFLARIIEAFQKRGYAANPQLLSAADYGVPQKRTRYIFLMHDRRRLQDPPAHPKPTHRPPGATGASALPETPTVEAVLAGLPQVGPGHMQEPIPVPGAEPIFNASTMDHSAPVIAKITAIRTGRGPISYRRLELGLAHTIIAGHRALPVHPTLHRTISSREAASLQGFRPSYRFLGGRGTWPLQVANSVPPPLGRAIADQLLDLLSRQL